MNILLVYKGTIPVKLYGGTERVIWYLGKELAKMGHQITYLVRAGSQCDFGKVLFIDEEKPLIKQIPEDIDIVHFNGTPKEIEGFSRPFVVTIHGNSKKTLQKNSIFVSKNHAARYDSDSFVYNGLDWDDYSTVNINADRKRFHFLGKAAWRIKNVKGAIDVVRASKSEQIDILGGVRFNTNMGIRFTFSQRAKFHGMVGGASKDAFLQQSKGLIFPVRWHEPFGLAIIESLFFACPIFGTPYGSLPELVNDEVGFLSNKQSELTQAIEHADSFSKQRCHDYAVEAFNSRKMAVNYLEKYEKVLDNQSLNPKPLQLTEVQQAKFLDWS